MTITELGRPFPSLFFCLGRIPNAEDFQALSILGVGKWVWAEKWRNRIFLIPLRQGFRLQWLRGTVSISDIHPPDILPSEVLILSVAAVTTSIRYPMNHKCVECNFPIMCHEYRLTILHTA